MRFAICCPDADERRRISSLIGEYAASLHTTVRTEEYRSEELLWQDFAPGAFRGVVVGCGDVKGFLCARRLREEDGACRVILIDDTERYAIRGLRIHLSDFLVRPLRDERLRSAIGRLFSE